MSSRASILAAAQRVIDEADRQKRDGVFPCIQCQYSRDGLIDLYCVHPIVQVAQMNCHDTYDRKRLARCSYQRSSKDYFGPVVCGESGELFEPAPDDGVGFFAWLRRALDC